MIRQRTGAWMGGAMLCAASLGCSPGGDASTSPARAAPASKLAIVCVQEQGDLGPREARLVYEGAASGALTLEGAFGDIKLDATRTKEKTDVGGVATEVVGIRARGPAKSPMPDKAALERCLVEAGADPADGDLIAYHLNLCQHKVAPGAEPADIDLEATIVVIGDDSNAEVFVRRTFREESAAAGGPMVIETLPSLSCKVS
jgi:hypothetical protein